MSDFWRDLLPFVAVTATAVVVMIAIAIKRSHRTVAILSLVGVGVALLQLLPTLGSDVSTGHLMGLLLVDGAGRFGMTLVLVATLGVLAIGFAYFERFLCEREEMYLLILTGTLGALTLCCAEHVATVLLGLELLGLPMVAAVAYAGEGRAIEAGVKYLVLSAAATATMLFGLALVFADTGALDIPSLAAAIGRVGFDAPLVATGSAMLLAGLAFKLSLVPFHQWTPDVYEGAPVPITAYLATVAKLGPIIAAFRFFHSGTGAHSQLVDLAIAGLALASMLVGSVLALRQTNLKRMLAYSSVAHFGFLAVVLAIPSANTWAAGVYLAAYVVTSIGVFGVMAVASSGQDGRERETIDDYRGLFWQSPYLAAVLIAMLLSLAGVPLTVGFVGKLVVVGAGVWADAWWLVGGVIVASLISAYYYLRVMGTVLQSSATGGAGLAGYAQTAGVFVLLLALAATLALGVYPQPLFDFARQFVLQ